MATFYQIGNITGGPTSFRFKFENHSNTVINFDLRVISGDFQNFGNVPPSAATLSTSFVHNDTLEYGNVAVVGIGQFGMAQLVPVPGVRFWSGFSEGGKGQYINLNAGNGWSVTKDSSSICEVTGNGFRITVDGGGGPQQTENIVFQVYNA